MQPVRARITDVIRYDDGSTHIRLVSLTRIAVVASLEVVNPPKADFDSVVGSELVIHESYVECGKNKHWARRVPWLKLELLHWPIDQGRGKG